TLSGEDSSGGVLHGGLSGGTSNIAVTGTRGSWGGKGAGGTHTGFRFQGVDRDVGAVELAGRPRVLMLPGAQPGLRGALAGVSVALLLYEDLNERIREEVRNKLIYGIQVFSAVTP
ncbi:MAG: hypothetical protein JWP91_2743, partial [Fibrobacteres bacterium]|nr:hypothetical protein [Fibrobacterota bacterium]